MRLGRLGRSGNTMRLGRLGNTMCLGRLGNTMRRIFTTHTNKKRQPDNMKLR